MRDNAPEDIGSSLLRRLAGWVARHPWQVVACWVLAAAVLLPLSPGLASVTDPNQADFLPASYESVRAGQGAAVEFPGQSGTTAVLAVWRRDRARLSAADQSEVQNLASTLGAAGIDRVTAVQTSPRQVSPDGTLQLVQIGFDGASSDPAVGAAVGVLRDRASTALRDTALTSGLSGPAAIGADTAAANAAAARTVGIATIVLVVVLLGVIFRSPLVALLPVVAVAVVYAVATSVLAIAARAMRAEVTGTLSTLLIVVLFGVGTDYVVFLLFRYREWLRAGRDEKDAIALTGATAGEAVASAAGTVMAAFAALLLSSLGSLRSMGPGLVLAVATMLLAALTLVPALFSLLGSRMFWPVRPRGTDAGSLWQRLGPWIAKHRVPAAAAVAAVLAALALGARGYSASYDSMTDLPAGTESLTAYDRIAASLPAGVVEPTLVYVSSRSVLDPAALQALGARLAAVPGVAMVRPPQLSADRTAAELTVLLRDAPTSGPSLDAIARLRAAAHGSVPGADVLVGGTTAQLADVRASYDHDLAIVLPVAAVVILLILAWFLRSLISPAYVLAVVALGFGASLGVTVSAFQGVAGAGGLDFTIPVVLYLFVVAIGTDYGILVMSALRESGGVSTSGSQAAARAIVSAGPPIATAAAVLAGTFASLLLTGIRSLQEIGVGVAAGVLIAAFLGAGVLIPSITAALWRCAWWPGRRAQRHAGQLPASARP